MDEEWAAKELAGVDLGAARLNNRSVTQLVSLPVGSGNLLQCAQERLQGRSTTAVEYRAAGTGLGTVHVHRLACSDAHAPGPDLPADGL